MSHRFVSPLTGGLWIGRTAEFSRPQQRSEERAKLRRVGCNDWFGGCWCYSVLSVSGNPVGLYWIWNGWPASRDRLAGEADTEALDQFGHGVGAHVQFVAGAQPGQNLRVGGGDTAEVN